MVLVLGLWFSLLGISFVQAEENDVTLLKAAFIYKFTKFIKWPENNQRSTIVLCTLGNDELVNVFASVLSNFGSNPKIVLQSIDKTQAIENCQVLYIALSEFGSYRSLNVITDKHAVLTISELPGFVQAGGIIELIQQGDRIRFDINLDASNLNGLVISSKLLQLARKVKWINKP